MDSTPDHALRTHLADHHGVLSTRAARRLGLDTNALRRLRKSGELVQVTRGAYVDGAAMRAAGPTEAHRLRTLAVVLSRHGRLAASHYSAATIYRLPVLHRDLGTVRVVHTGAADNTRTHDAFTVYRCPGATALSTDSGIPTVVPAMAVLGTAICAGLESGVMVADAALHRGLTTMDELHSWLARLERVPGVSRARSTVAAASPSAESPGESRLRLILVALGYDVVAQHSIVTADGHMVARVNFYLPELGVVVEFDGRVKYEGARGGDALAAEKRREDDIRALGHGVARIVWDDLGRPLRVAAIVRAAARIHGSRHA